MVEIRPQPGPQTAFLSCSADIIIFGGAAGGGKTYALLLEFLRHLHNNKFNGIVFRRNSKQIRNPGGLWDTSLILYSSIGGLPKSTTLEWKFEEGLKVKFDHLEYDHTVLSYQGAQIPAIFFDELTHFSESQFWYMASRLRSVSGVPGYMRATTNPDPDSWVRKFIDWWIGPDGLAIPERSGVIRWFYKIGDNIEWADSKEELHAKYGHGPEVQPKSLTFILSKLEDNKILMDKDPTYLSNLLSMNRVDRMRLYGANWNVRPSAGMLFQREWFEVVDAIPAGYISAIRFWDRAATKPNETNKDPDWTRGLKLLRYPNNTFIVTDLKSTRDTPGRVEDLIKNVASHDGRTVKIMSQQDPGSAGVGEAENFKRMLAGYNVDTMTTSKDKITRAKPVSAQCESGNIKILRAPWNEDFFSELENFPEGAHDDIVDTLSGAFNELAAGTSILDAFRGR